MSCLSRNVVMYSDRQGRLLRRVGRGGWLRPPTFYNGGVDPRQFRVPPTPSPLSRQKTAQGNGISRRQTAHAALVWIMLFDYDNNVLVELLEKTW